MKISILAAYFGNLPAFAQLFLESCNRNPSIEFLLVGDAWEGLGQDDVPSNCRLIPIGMADMKERILRQTGFQPNFESPYKLCDFKPAFGEVFGPELEGADYWGFTDIDLVLGNLPAFLGELGRYDVFSSRKEFLSGPFFLMRNTAEVNGLYRKSKDVRTVLESEHHVCFDECNFAWVELREGKSILEVETRVESMTEVIAKAQLEGLSAHFETLSLEPRKAFRGRAAVEHGRVLMDGREFIHYHHHWNKGRMFYTFPQWDWRSVPDRYTISRHGVYSRDAGLDWSWRLSQAGKCLQRRLHRRVNGASDTNASKIT